VTKHADHDADTDIDTGVDTHLPLTTVAFEILLALGEGERHGYDIMLAIEQRTGGRISLNPGTLYRALDRLTERGLLSSAEGERRGGAGDGPRRFFQSHPLATDSEPDDAVSQRSAS